MNREIAHSGPIGWLGVISALLGTLIAVVLLPPDPAEAGALILPALVLATGILLIPTIRLFSGSEGMLNAENFVAFGFVYWILLDPIQGAYDLHGTTDDAIVHSMIAVGVSAAAMWAGTVRRPWRVPSTILALAKRPIHADNLLQLAIACFLLGMAKFMYAVNFDLPAMFSYLGESRWLAPWGRGQLGGWDAFLDHTQYFGYVLPSIAALLIVRRGWLHPTSMITIGFALIMLLFLAQGGGRRIIGVTVGAAIIVWVLTHPGLKLTKVIGLIVSVAALLAGMQFILEIRGMGYEGFIDKGRQYSYLHVDDNFLRLAQIIELIPSEFPFVYFQQIFFILIRPIPRVLWEGKPVDPGFDLSTTVGMEGVSLSISILGEWYLSFGWVGLIFGGWLHGRLATAVNVLRYGDALANNPMIYALSVMVLVSGIRSMQDLVIMSYAVLAWIAVGGLINRNRQTRLRV